MEWTHSRLSPSDFCAVTILKLSCKRFLKAGQSDSFVSSWCQLTRYGRAAGAGLVHLFGLAGVRSPPLPAVGCLFGPTVIIFFHWELQLSRLHLEFWAAPGFSYFLLEKINFLLAYWRRALVLLWLLRFLDFDFVV